MNIGDLVTVSSRNNEYFGEIGVVTQLPNDGFFVIVLVQSGEFWFSPESLQVMK